MYTYGQKGGYGIRGVERDALAKQRPEKNKNIIRYVTGRKKCIARGNVYTRGWYVYTVGRWGSVGGMYEVFSGWMMIYF